MLQPHLALDHIINHPLCKIQLHVLCSLSNQWGDFSFPSLVEAPSTDLVSPTFRPDGSQKSYREIVFDVLIRTLERPRDIVRNFIQLELMVFATCYKIGQYITTQQKYLYASSSKQWLGALQWAPCISKLNH